uniref:Uncharacterized protein n=1 Tax=Eutreptiella gymnastica TaxID=73025 RepID=A0A7S4GFT4_9EUGL
MLHVSPNRRLYTWHDIQQSPYRLCVKIPRWYTLESRLLAATPCTDFFLVGESMLVPIATTKGNSESYHPAANFPLLMTHNPARHTTSETYTTVQLYLQHRKSAIHLHAAPHHKEAGTNQVNTVMEQARFPVVKQASTSACLLQDNPLHGQGSCNLVIRHGPPRTCQLLQRG